MGLRLPMPRTAISAFGWFWLAVFGLCVGLFVAFYAIFTRDLACFGVALICMAALVVVAVRTAKRWV